MPDYWNVSRYGADNDVVFRLDLYFAAAQHSQARVNQESSENVNDPAETIN